ncbi:cell division protein DivIC [Streptococcus australis]|jgi:cell division protein divIC, putative|uniref:Cell division protein DivIC n=2 Tax=Streptococcus TaxID=1301 RepID=A0A3S4PYE8_9STRE|nr:MULTISPECIES: septum formation initiator family protein [Streptococcus]EFW00027.1 septum formation initiator [Streptococcus australis ATCC 700641]MBS4898574.1 septum formation initiator family protein [Streptococcus sp.]MDB8642922.1 septum formation initiator family protein [Streptococcus australis]MDB8646206.1 septum formation initiator family protein [Streptococcus australis]SQH65398.1 cell division protein DivIC [Streptococcus australis]
MPKNIVQMNNRYIQDEHQRRKYQNEEQKKQNRFMGWVLILIILLFILPTYNLAQSYQTLQKRKQQYVQLQEQYQQTLEEKEYQKDIVEKLKDDEYAAKYARAKYSFSKDGEYIYTIPNLLPK